MSYVFFIFLILFSWLVGCSDDVEWGYSWTPSRSNHGPINFVPTLALFVDTEFKFDDTILEVAWLFFYINLIWRRKPIIADRHQGFDDLEPMDGGVLMSGGMVPTVKSVTTPANIWLPYAEQPEQPRCGYPYKVGPQTVYCTNPATPGCAFCEEHGWTLPNDPMKRAQAIANLTGKPVHVVSEVVTDGETQKENKSTKAQN